jgi:hypothetical protein
VEKLKKRDNYEDTDVSGRIISIWNLERQDGVL